MALTLPVKIGDYRERINGSHDFDITVQVLTMEEKILSSARLLDGQINFQRESTVRRTATLTLLDPSQALALDTDDPTEGALFANRLIRVQHSVKVGTKTVRTTCFVGPIVRVNRSGPTLDVEAQDKSALAMTGSKPYRVPKGKNAVDAMADIMADCTGEARFRLVRSRYRLPKSLAVGWTDEASPWAVVQRIARMAGLRAFYAADGFFTVAPRQSTAAWTFDEDNLTSDIEADHDISGLINYVRVTSSDERETVVKTAAPAASHPLSAQSLGRNGAPRWLPALSEVSGIGAKPKKPKKSKAKSEKTRRKADTKRRREYAEDLREWNESVKATGIKAAKLSQSLLKAGLAMESDISFDAIPVYHLDTGDLVRVNTTGGTILLRLLEASIPLVSGDMTVGSYRRVSRPPRARR